MIPGDQGGGGYQYQLVNMAGGWGTFNDTRPRSAHTFAKNANVWGHPASGNLLLRSEHQTPHLVRECWDCRNVLHLVNRLVSTIDSATFSPRPLPAMWSVRKCWPA